ncbi:MAG: hypothetical protein ACRDN0_35285, partial [Trebonia sp.]
MSEAQLAERIRTALDESTAGVRIPASAAARARTKGRRRRVGRGLLAVVPAVVIVAGVVVAAHGGAPAHEATASPVTSPPVRTDAYVTRHVEMVLGTAGNYIIETSATSGPGQVTTTYLDPSTGTARSVVSGAAGSGAGDRAVYWIQSRVSGDEDQWQTTYVDYARHTWWTKTSHSAALGQDTSALPVLNAQSPPAEISRALALGDLRISVKGTVNGHAAIELVYAGPLAAKADAVHYWVDATTYQPVQIDLPPFTAASTINESWIPKTAANVT